MISPIRLELLSWYLRRSPWELGRWRLLHYTLPLAAKTLPNAGSRIVRTRYGFKLHVEFHDWLGRHVFITGEYEPPTSKVMSALLEPGCTMVDIGANIGYFTLLASKRVGPSGTVLAFEPVPRTRERLEHNLQLNNVQNVKVGPEAVCDRAGETTFYEGPEHHRGLSSLRPMEAAAQEIHVPTARLDDLLPNNCTVNLVKIDVEGAECQVLDGMTKCLERDQPDLIIEVTDEFLRGMGRSAESLVASLQPFGYKTFVIDHDGLQLLDTDSGKWPRQFNALFTVRRSLPNSLNVTQNMEPDTSLKR